MKKLLLVLLALCVFALPAMAQDKAADELKTLSNQQILAVYDVLVKEITARNIDTSTQTIRDSNIVFGENIHIQTGQLTVCLPTAVPDTNLLTNPGLLPTQIPTPTSALQIGNKATYDSQSPVDGTHVAPGTSFDIHWYLLNSGTTTWTTDYSMRYFSGTNFTKPGKNRWGLVRDVPPNAVGDCVVDAVAPSKPGTYTMAVVLGDESDQNFMVVDVTIIVD